MTRPDALSEPWQHDARAEVELDRELRGAIAAIIIIAFLAMAAAFWTGWLARGWLL